MAKPPNISGDINGFNTQMFKSKRAVRRGFLMLGYGINPRDADIPANVVRQFQRDYNKCSERFGRWGKVDINGKLDKPTLNGLEHAIRWAKKRENRDGTPSARSWQALCGNRAAACIDDSECGNNGRRRKYAQPDVEVQPRETNYIEVCPDGTGKLRNILTEDALRCNILAFERHGEVIFAVAEVPPQGDLLGGRPQPITCPCMFAR